MTRPKTVAQLCVLALGLLLGLASPTTTPGCIIPDYCIVLNTEGTDWCLYVENAQMWPVGQPELAEPVLGPDGSVPKGCRCFNDAEGIILGQGVPAPQFQQLFVHIEEDARNECAWAVPAGYDHTCFVTSDPSAPMLAGPYAGESNLDCIGSCSFINPPPNGSCGDDPNPWECNDDGSLEPAESGDETSDDDESDGSDTGEPGITPGIRSGDEVVW